MRTYFDSSVLVPLLNEKSPHYAEARGFWLSSTERVTSCHALAETYRTLTTLKNPIPTKAASRLIRGLSGTVEFCPSASADYLAAVERCADQGLSGAIVYDAAHVAMARAARVDRIVTRNKKHFDLFAAGIRGHVRPLRTQSGRVGG